MRAAALYMYVIYLFNCVPMSLYTYVAVDVDHVGGYSIYGVPLSANWQKSNRNPNTKTPKLL